MIYAFLALGYTVCWWIIASIFRVDEPVQFAVGALWYTLLGCSALLFLAMLKVIILG